MDPEKRIGDERRRSTPVELKHIGVGPRIAGIGLAIALFINILITGMAYQRLVDDTNHNSEDIAEMVGLLRESDVSADVAGLKVSVQHLTEDVREIKQALSQRE